MTKKEEAKAYHDKGFNCAQAVALPFCEELGMPKQAAMKALEGFGAGMGDRMQTCGALSGAVFVAGLKHSDGNLEAPASKAATYAICGKVCQAFKEKCGSTVCKEIKELSHLSCGECIALGVELAENI